MSKTHASSSTLFKKSQPLNNYNKIKQKMEMGIIKQAYRMPLTPNNIFFHAIKRKQFISKRGNGNHTFNNILILRGQRKTLINTK